jgi:hypothetical protein
VVAGEFLFYKPGNRAEHAVTIDLTEQVGQWLTGEEENYCLQIAGHTTRRHDYQKFWSPHSDDPDLRPVLTVVTEDTLYFLWQEV